MVRKNKKLSRYFKLEQFVKCEIAEQTGISNQIPEKYLPNLRNLCEQVLVPLRHHTRKDFKIVCGYLNKQLNELSHGVGESQHLYGEAADIEIPDIETGLKWFFWIKFNCEFDQLILEHKHDGSTCIHVSCKLDLKKNRLMVLRTPLKRVLPDVPQGDISDLIGEVKAIDAEEKTIEVVVTTIKTEENEA